jgi:hypothetical protein
MNGAGHIEPAPEIRDRPAADPEAVPARAVAGEPSSRLPSALNLATIKLPLEGAPFGLLLPAMTIRPSS